MLKHKNVSLLKPVQNLFYVILDKMRIFIKGIGKEKLLEYLELDGKRAKWGEWCEFGSFI
jgi:hypothetical protein